MTLKPYFFESCKITLFALAVTFVFKFFGAPDDMLVIMFAMAVMSSAATFSIDRKAISHIALGGAVVMLSLIVGGLVGQYDKTYIPLFVTIYAGLAFYLPKTREKITIYTIGAVMFLIFTYLPFSWERAHHYIAGGAFVYIAFVFFYWLIDHTKGVAYKQDQSVQGQAAMALVAVVSLAIGWVFNLFFKHYTNISHLYWIPLTILVVIQCSQKATIQTSIKRIFTNVLGAVIIVFLYNYIIPDTFFLNFALLVFFLFMIFFLGFSYVARTLFIEMFVLGFSHILGNAHSSIAFDRVFLTLVGGIIVMAVTPVVYRLVHART